MRPYQVILVSLPFALFAASSQAQNAVPSGTMPAFQSDAELLRYVRALAQENVRLREEAAAAAKAAEAACAAAALPTTVLGGPSSVRAAVLGGTVRDPSGAAISGARVTLGAIALGVTSGADGRFRIVVPAESLAAPRTVSISARQVGRRLRSATVVLHRGDSVDVAMTLCTEQSIRRRGAMSLNYSDGPSPAPAPAKEPSITNNQHAGVDEGDIVKLHGDHLVMLRRGRLFTVAIGGNALRPIAAVDAFGPGVDPNGTWYDELLVSDDKVVVIGYSYARGGTEVGVFGIDRGGSLRHLATYQLRSNDYYSARNYASRLIGSKLVFYTPLYLPAGIEDPLAQLPAMRSWRAGAGEAPFHRIVAARRIYRPARELDASGALAMHTVTVCDLAALELECQATVVLGPPGRVFYVSGSAVYVWTSEWARPGRSETASAMLVRMPLDGSSPSALSVAGSPVDQFSFLESNDGQLNVLVRAAANGDAMFAVEHSAGSAALLRVPITSFGDGGRSAPWWLYRTLPTPEGDSFQNRFVGDHLLYGTGNGWGRPRSAVSTLYVLPWKGGDVTRIGLPYGVDRIEVMGSSAVVIGTDGRDLHFSGIRLGPTPEIVQRYTMAGASQGELRSHGFFYRSDDASTGVLGLPVRGPGRPGYSHLIDGSASILFLRNDGEGFRELGTLEAHARDVSDDACKASCIDWYGNARPIFVRGRVFALMGYEMVEGRVAGDRIDELRRVSYLLPGMTAVRH